MLLLIHIIISIAMLAGSFGLLAAGWFRKKLEIIRTFTIASWISSFVTGVTLVISGGSFTHFCLTVSAISLMMIVADRFYVYRLKDSFSGARN
ncbi:MAG TPA: hypothetical protein VGE34_02465 [Candidatus Saccharimonadales bacterium]